MTTVLCLASYFKGLQLLTAYRQLGCRVVVIAGMDLRDQPWPEDCIDDIHFMPDMYDLTTLIKGVSYLAREERFDRVVPMEEYCMAGAAALRAHLGISGIDETTARRVRDKFIMRGRAKECGIPVPAFELVLNRSKLAEFAEKVEGPWLIKPRAEAGAVKIEKIHNADEMWEAVSELGDDESNYLIEDFIPGDVCHVDSVIHKGKPVVSVASRYGKPPFDVWNGGGVFMSSTVPDNDPLQARLLELNKKVVSAMGIEWGVSHVEFIHGKDGELYFLELGARVCGANLDRLVWAASGIDLFYEQARVDLANFRGEKYTLKRTQERHAGLLVCLTAEKEPDLGGVAAKDVVWTLKKDYHAGVVVAAPTAKKVADLMKKIGQRLADEHLAVLPAADRPT